LQFLHHLSPYRHVVSWKYFFCCAVVIQIVASFLARGRIGRIITLMSFLPFIIYGSLPSCSFIQHIILIISSAMYTLCSLEQLTLWLLLFLLLKNQTYCNNYVLGNVLSYWDDESIWNQCVPISLVLCNSLYKTPRLGSSR
jgi:hypothetical protein